MGEHQIESRVLEIDPKLSDPFTQDHGRTLIQSPFSSGLGQEDPPDRFEAPEDCAGRDAVNLGLLCLLGMMLLPSVTPALAVAGIRRSMEVMEIPGQGMRATIAIALSSMALLCGLFFWILWALMRPSPLGILVGWVGLRHLPAVPFGFQHTPQDPFGWSPSSFRLR